MPRALSSWSRSADNGGLTTGMIFFAFYTIVPNIPMWVAIPSLNLERHGTFSLEYMVVGVIALFVPRLLSATMLFGMISADVVYDICQTYVLSPEECLRSVTSIRDLSYGRILAAAIVTSLALLVATTAILLPAVSIEKRDKFVLAGYLFGTASAFFVVDVVIIARTTGQMPAFKMGAPSD